MRRVCNNTDEKSDPSPPCPENAIVARPRRQSAARVRWTKSRTKCDETKSRRSPVFPSWGPRATARTRMGPRALAKTSTLRSSLSFLAEAARARYERFSSPTMDVRDRSRPLALIARVGRLGVRARDASFLTRRRNASGLRTRQSSLVYRTSRGFITWSRREQRVQTRVHVFHRLTHRKRVSNRAVGAVKAIRSLRLWSYETFKSHDVLHLVCMATPEDVAANAEYV